MPATKFVQRPRLLGLVRSAIGAVEASCQSDTVTTLCNRQASARFACDRTRGCDSVSFQIPCEVPEVANGTDPDSQFALQFAFNTGVLGDSQAPSHETGDQIALPAPDAEGRRKSRRRQQLTTTGSAHKKEPPLGLEPRTYALRKRRSAD